MNHLSICTCLKMRNSTFNTTIKENANSNFIYHLMFVVSKKWGWSSNRIFPDHEIKACGPLLNFNTQGSKYGVNLVEKNAIGSAT